jgi:hypothetical protein
MSHRKIQCLLCSQTVQPGPALDWGMSVPQLDASEVNAIVAHSEECLNRGGTHPEWWRAVDLERIVLTNGVPFDIDARV